MKKIILLITLITFTSCSKRIVGEWKVSKYQTIKPEIENITLSNIGTMTFKSNNTGEKNLDYTVLGIVKKDNIPFTWSSTEETVTINSENSDFAKTWIIIENKRKHQVWKSTNGQNEIQTIELSK